MIPNPSTRARAGVIAALALVAVLAGVLATRLLAREPSRVNVARRAPVATVPAPKPIDVATLEMPCWACPDAPDGPLRFRTDLDMLAPLGTGSGNAAEWFAAFRKPDGPRLAEAVAAEARRVDHPPIGRVLPPDDPLLVEAEPWCDQATMRFYPDVLPLRGAETPLSNLLLALTFARSWLARGEQSADFDAAMADFRRVVRLGRLLRQEDVVLINDLVGLACIRIGLDAIYNRARTAGRLDLALAASVAAGEAAPQRYLTAARVTSVELRPYVRKAADGSVSMALPDERMDAIVAMVTSCPDRRFRGEALWNLEVVATLGTEAQKAKARDTLDAATHSDDPRLAAMARSFHDRPLTPEGIAAAVQ
jgi:hypothetical protein